MQHRTTFTLLTLTILTSLVTLTSPVRAASPMIQGWAWIDQNCDGIRQDTEKPATYDVMTSSPYLYRFGPDGQPFTADDSPVRTLSVYDNGTYTDVTDSAIVVAALPNERYRLSILQGGRPVNYVPTLYRQGSDPARWSSLQSNWTTGDPNNGGFALDPNGTVTGGNIGIAPASCTAQWYTQHTYLPLLAN